MHSVLGKCQTTGSLILSWLGCVCVCTTEKRPRSDLIPSDMDPVAQRGRVLVDGTHREAGPGLERTPLLKAQPALFPFFSVVCISLVFSYAALTFPFFFFSLGKISCQCPTRSKVIWMCCSLVGTTGASVLAQQGPAVFIWSVWEVVGGGAFCWLGRGSFSPT